MPSLPSGSHFHSYVLPTHLFAVHVLNREITDPTDAQGCSTSQEQQHFEGKQCFFHTKKMLLWVIESRGQTINLWLTESIKTHFPPFGPNPRHSSIKKLLHLNPSHFGTHSPMLQASLRPWLSVLCLASGWLMRNFALHIDNDAGSTF